MCLGFAQLVSWGVAYYLIGAFGPSIAADLGWSAGKVYAGFATGLLIMGLASQFVGRAVDMWGGRLALSVGALLICCGCIALSVADDEWIYFGAWLLLGLAMRLTLYDAAFAALVRIGGPGARGPMSQITLLGGLASTVFWPLGNFLDQQLGWRAALLVYAAIALTIIPLVLQLPVHRHGDISVERKPALVEPRAAGRRELLVAGGLYALISTLMNFLNVGMSSHMIVILSGLGLAMTTSVWVSTLRGIGQSLARLAEVMFGAKLDPLLVNMLTCLLMPCGFIAGLFGGLSTSAALAFAFIFGVSNGIVTITRGTLPLVLFDHRTYGNFVGRLLAPSFVVSASAPLVYAWVSEHFGAQGALLMSLAIAVVALVASGVLLRLFGVGASPRQAAG